MTLSERTKKAVRDILFDEGVSLEVMEFYDDDELYEMAHQICIDNDTTIDDMLLMVTITEQETL